MTDPSVFIIAEIGSNHAQSLSVATESIEAAARAGANAVKFQSIQLDELYHEPTEQTRELHRRIDLPEEWHQPLKDHCEQHNVTFVSSPTYLRAIDILEDVGVAAYKLASAQVAVFPQLVDRVARLGKPVYLSTGLVTFDELDETVKIFRAANNARFTILHCNSVYPAEPAIVHLRHMKTIADRYGSAVGFSDHTASSTAAIAAVALGATALEKHFTLSRSLDTPDAICSIEPGEFTAYVAAIRETEQILSPETDRMLEASEADFRARIQHGLLTTTAIRAGDRITAGVNVILKRCAPPESLTASEFWRLPTDLVATRAIPAGDWLRDSDVT